MADKWATNGGVYLGIATDRLQGEPPHLDLRAILADALDRHIVLVGANGTGKTRRLLLPNLVRLADWSTVVVDPKGILARITEGVLRTRRIVLDPFRVLGDQGVSCNPVYALDPDSDDFIDDAMLMAETLITIAEREPHWGQAAQDVLCGLIIYVRIKYGPKGTLQDVRRLLALPQEAMQAAVKDMIATSEQHKFDPITPKIARLADWTSDNREISSVMATALAQTRWMDSPPIINNLGAANVIDFGLIKRVPTTIFLVLPPFRMRTHAMWMRLMLSSILQPLMKDTSSSTVPVLFMLDEYYSLAKGGLPVIEDNMAMFREFGIKLWLCFQDVAQAYVLYGQHGWQSYIANSGVFQALGANDALTAECISNLSGEHMVPVGGTSGGFQINPGGNLSTSGGTNISFIKLPVVLPADARAIGAGYSIVFSPAFGGQPARVYSPYPTQLPWTADLMRNDPSA